jgi:hypothetical protein
LLTGKFRGESNCALQKEGAPGNLSGVQLGNACSVWTTVFEVIHVASGGDSEDEIMVYSESLTQDDTAHGSIESTSEHIWSSTAGKDTFRGSPGASDDAYVQA